MSRSSLLRLALAVVIGGLAAIPRPVSADDLPKPSPDNTFYVYCIWDAVMSAPEETIRTEMDEMLRQFGPGNAYHKPGVAFIFPGQSRPGSSARSRRKRASPSA